MPSDLPHIQFYVGDWRKDLAIQSISYHHRGIWFELLMLMHCSEQRGRLVLSGKPMTNASLARLLGLSEQESQSAVEVLLSQGVASRDQNGALICRRMVREEELRQKRREVGSKGGSKTAAKREQTPDNDIDNDGLLRVREFAKGRGIAERDADWFYHKGRANGWTNGGRPILDWKATLLSWQRAGYLPSQKQGNGQRPLTFQKPKEAAPVYPKLPPKRELSDEEIQRNKEIAEREVAKLREQFKMPT